MPLSFLSGWFDRRPESSMRIRFAAALTAILFVFIVLGCMNFSIGGRTLQRSSDEEPFEQEGKVELGPGVDQIVYYPIPYAQTPNLELDDSFGIELMEQARDHFRVRDTKHVIFGCTVAWKARGIKEPSPIPPLAPANAAPLPSSPFTPTNPPPPSPVPYAPDH